MSPVFKETSGIEKVEKPHQKPLTNNNAGNPQAGISDKTKSKEHGVSVDRSDDDCFIRSLN